MNMRIHRVATNTLPRGHITQPWLWLHKKQQITKFLTRKV